MPLKRILPFTPPPVLKEAEFTETTFALVLVASLRTVPTLRPVRDWVVIFPSGVVAPILPWKFKLPVELTLRSNVPSRVLAKVTSALLIPVEILVAPVRIVAEFKLIAPPLLFNAFPLILMACPAIRLIEPEEVVLVLKVSKL